MTTTSNFPRIASLLSPATAAKVLAVVSVTATALGGSLAANAGELADQRGYQNCVKALDTKDLSGVTFPRVYYINKTAASSIYYVNASAWQNGERVTKRVTCEMTRNGRDLLAFETAEGRFALADRNRLSVAER